MPKNKCPRKLKDCKLARCLEYGGGAFSCAGIAKGGTGNIKGDIMRFCDVNSCGSLNSAVGYTPDEMLANVAVQSQALLDWVISNKDYQKWRKENLK